MDVRLRTFLIVEKDGLYLVGWDYVMCRPKWSNSPFEAWRTRDRIKAAMVAERLDGQLFLFNPIVSQIKAY